MHVTPTPTDRRHVRRAETIEEILGVAVEVMAEQGVAGLSLGEVARRVGIRTPSLYVYFESKHALYDAVFARGWHEIDEVMRRVGEPQADEDLAAYALEMAETFVAWMVRHPVYAQLMSWRPVPGYEPSPESYEIAQAVFDRSTRLMAQLQALGLFRADADPVELLRGWTVLTSGVMTQQLANAPHEPFEAGTFTTLLPQFVAMFLAHYAPPAAPTSERKHHARRRRLPR
jgi:AcrR family transcriptional regulator